MEKASQHYVDFISSARDNLNDENKSLIEPLLRQPELFLPLFHQIDHVLFFIDYSSGTYPYVSPNSKAVQGYPADQVMEEGPSRFIQRLDPADLKVINEQLFSDMLRLVKTIDLNNLNHYKLCLNYRIIQPDGSARMMHQQSNILKVNGNKEPLLMVGTMSQMKDGFKSGELFLRFSRFDDHNGWELLEECTYKTTGNGTVPELSEAEKKVLQYIKIGLTSKETAAQLNLSPETINRHRKNIIKKLNASNMIDALSIAKNNGML